MANGGRNRFTPEEIAIPVGACLVTLALMPAALARLRARGLVVVDMYKPGRPTIATHAGIVGLGLAVAVLFVLVLIEPVLLLFPYAVPLGANPILISQLLLFTICGYGIVGAIDDRHSLSHLTKAAVPLTLGLPAYAIALTHPEAQGLLGFLPVLAANAPWVLLVVVPVYVLVVTNLVNMHSGFNGLQSGLSLLLLGTLLLRLGLAGRLEENLPLLAMFGYLVGFFPFNRYPAKAIEGNVGSFLIGATIGVGIAANGLYLAGVVMLAPHILDFLLFVYTKAAGLPFKKFGRLREDGTVEAPYPYKLKFLLPYYFHLSEQRTVVLLWALSLAACILSFAVPL